MLSDRDLKKLMAGLFSVLQVFIMQHEGTWHIGGMDMNPYPTVVSAYDRKKQTQWKYQVDLDDNSNFLAVQAED